MKSLSNRSKAFLVTLGILLILFFSKHWIFATCLQVFLGKATQNQFEYFSRTWEDGKLVYEGVSFNNELSSRRVEFTPHFSLSPVHLTLGIYLIEPHFKLSTASAPAFNLSFFVPTKWTTVRLDIERGALSIDENPVGLVEFVSSETPDVIGKLILSEDDKSAYCTADLSFNGVDLSYRITCVDAPVHHLQTFATLFMEIPLMLESGKLNAELYGSGLDVHGSMKGYDLSLKHGKYRVEKGELNLHLYQDKPPYLFAKGHCYSGEFQTPFSCDYHQGKGHLSFLGSEIPFTLAQQEKTYIFNANLQSISLQWLEIPKGILSAKVKAEWLDNNLRSLEIKDILLLNDTTEPILGEIAGKGPIDQLRGEFHASTSFYEINGKGSFQLQDEKLHWQGNFLVLSDAVQAQGTFDIPAMRWTADFHAPCTVLSKYTPYFPEGNAEIKGTCTPHALSLTCIGSNIVFQKEDLLLQMHGKTSPVQINYHLHSRELFADMSLSPAVLYLKNLNSPIYLESGAMQFKNRSLEIVGLEACVEEIAFIGNLHATQNHLQLTSRSVMGSIQDLALFDERMRGWEGEFSCGEKEFLLHVDLNEMPKMHPHFQITAHLKNISRRLTEHLVLSALSTTCTYESTGGEFSCSNVSGVLGFNGKEISVSCNKLLGAKDSFSFEGSIPNEKIAFAGSYGDNEITLSHASFGKSKIIAPFTLSLDSMWKLSGSAFLSLDSISHYLSLLNEAGFLNEISLPPLSGELSVKGWMTKTHGSFDLSSNGLQVGETVLSKIDGHIEKENSTYKTSSLTIGETQLQGYGIYDLGFWRFPAISMQYQDLHLQGDGSFEKNVISANAHGKWKECDLKGNLKWNVKNSQGMEGVIQCAYESFDIQCTVPTMHWKDGKLQISRLEVKASHPLLKESLEAPLTVTWTPKQLLFQGPLRAGLFSHELFECKPREIQGLFENGILHFQSKLNIHETLIKLKGHFFVLEGGRGATNLMEGEDHLHIGFQSFSEISKIEGRLLGVECKLNKKSNLFEGNIKLASSDPLANCIKKTEWKGIRNLDFTGEISYPILKGVVTGSNVVFKGYVLETLKTDVDYSPTRFIFKDLQIEDLCGQLHIKEIKGMRTHPLKSWELLIPTIRGQKIQPSLLRKIGAPHKEPKPFQMRQLTLSHVTGIIGRPLTFTGTGTFYFTQKERKDPSLFDLPRAFLKEWGLDLALLSPVRGSVDVELKQGKMFLTSLSDSFSDGEHSEFQLVENEPSYIDFAGALFLNLRMKQNVALKLVEPFTLSVRGTWEKPHYTLR